MRLFDAFDAAGFHTSICTTFDIDFEAFESIALARMLKKRCTNNVLIADSGMITLALDQRKLPRLAGTKYSVVGATSSGVFHPKLLLQVGPKTGRLLVASANMTSSGLAGNLEVVGQVTLEAPEGPETGLLRAAYDYLSDLLPKAASVARDQLQWAYARTPWLRNATPSPDLLDASGTLIIRFLAHGGPTGIGARFVDAVGPSPVRRLIVVSPYWDDSLSALTWLNHSLAPSEIALVVQKEAGLFPRDALDASLPVRIFPARPLVASSKAGRFVHAKVLIAQTENADHVLYGSTNCTNAALGSSTYVGANQEASLYRRLERGGALHLLGLDSALGPDQAIDVESLPDYQKGEELPLNECARRSSGTFEVRGEDLTWNRPAHLANSDATFDLLDVRGLVLEVDLARTLDDGQRASYRLTSAVLPPFARARHNGQVLATSIVISAEELRRAQVAESAKKAQSALAALDDPDSLNEFNLLELFAELDDIDRAAAAALIADGAPASAPVPPSLKEGRQLTYEEFVAERHAAPTDAAQLGESSLCEGLSDTVRQVLNRILGLGAAQSRIVEEVQEPDKKDVLKLFKRGDETADGAKSVESGEEEEDDGAGEVRDEAAPAVAVVKRRQIAMKESQREIVKKIEEFLAQQKAAKTQRLSPSGLLKLRLLLQLVLATGSASEELLSTQAKTSRRVTALLPCRGEGSWPALACRLLYEFFFRRRPAPHQPIIARLVLDVDDAGALPIDVAEALFVCQWVMLAVCSAKDERGKDVAAPLGANKLRTDIYGAVEALIGLTNQADLREQTWAALSRSYAGNLGVFHDRVFCGHNLALREAMLEVQAVG